MGENSNIEWTDHTFNPWVGCTKISPACDHCYAESWAKRAGRGDLWAGSTPQRTSAANWRQPLKWNAQAAAAGRRARVFCASLADVFDNAADPQWRADLFGLIQQTPHLDWLLLTKRIGNANVMIAQLQEPQRNWWPLPNVWLGATIANQVEADRDIPKLLRTPAAVRFLSCEPLLGAINLEALRPGVSLPRIDCLRGIEFGTMRYERPRIDWVIAGGESGPKARPMHPAWPRSLRDQCSLIGVPFLFKQWGEWEIASHENGYTGHRMPDTGERFTWVGIDGRTSNPSALELVDAYAMAKAGKKKAGRVLDGRTWDEFPNSHKEPADAA